MKKYGLKRIISMVLCMAMLMAQLPALAQAAQSPPAAQAADPSTMDGWKAFFPTEGRIHTENAGGVWTDKSVFTEDTPFQSHGIAKDGADSFLVALSAMASTMTVTGMSNTPTDTMLVLDVSGSMNDNQGNNNVAAELVQAANESISTLLATNPHNRVGVVLYSGPTAQGGATGPSDAVLMLPLGRYTTDTDGAYLTYAVSGRRETTETVSLDADVVYEGTDSHPAARSKTVVGGTYIQKGLALAAAQFTAAANGTTVEDPILGTLTRKPILVLMSDGAPTVATTNFTAPEAINLGDGTYTNAAIGFVTQLTAAWVKARIEAKYGTDSLFYTLGLGTGNDAIATSVLDPANSSTAINDFWTRYRAAAVGGTVTLQRDPRRTVTKIETALEQGYVDRYFAVSGDTDLATGLLTAFQDIVATIQLQSRYFPTLVQGSEHTSGYISFVDRIGSYMEVTDIKGILIGDHTLFSGADLARNFVAGGGALGTYDAPTALGKELIHAVMARIGLATEEEARTLIGLAYEQGQLRYTGETDFSNYIGWYANAAGEFLGFWYEGIATMPQPTGDAATDPAYIMRSYCYLGEVNGMAKSDMMYATVQVRQEIATGEQTVLFAVPAALIPTVAYAVTLDEAGNLKDLTVSGGTVPIRLVYEVALDSRIDSFTVNDLVSPEYREANTDANGNIRFYTNQYEADNTTGYGKVNTYSYFRPSRDNDRYYYQEVSPVYTDTQGTLYRGSTAPTGAAYYGYTVYSKNGTALEKATVYHPLPAETLATAHQAANDDTWYIPAGDVRRDYADFVDPKTENVTGTLPNSAAPFTDIHGHSVDELNHNFVVGATLGNNGVLRLAPATGIALTKVMAPGAAAPTSAFRFVISNRTDPADNGTYPARVLHADGSRSVTAVPFENGRATVALNAGETFYIGGMVPGTQLTVAEEETLDYVADAAIREITVAEGQLIAVTFVNADRGSGNLTVSKEVLHSLGTDYVIPDALRFTVRVQLTGIGTASAAFAALYSDGTAGTVTTDATGSFTLELGHNQQVTLLDLPAGTVATVTEPDPGTGFTAAYRDSDPVHDGTVTVPDGATASVTVTNTYAPQEVYPVNVVLDGTKVFVEDWNGNTFQFQLQEWTDGGWVTIDTAEATEAAPYFSFTEALQAETFTAPGTYNYRVLEVNGGQTLDGITYDATVHTFGIAVSDADMDGKLEIANVISYHTGTSFGKNANGDWQISIRFRNTYNATGCSLTLDVRKALVNASGSPLVSPAGFQFGLYDETGALIATSDLTNGVGEARFHLTYALADEGIHTYTLKELMPAAPIPGMVYDPTTYTVVVEVTDNGDGTTSAAIRSINGAAAFETPVFTNTYDIGKVELPIDFVGKALTGRAQKTGEFTFELRDADGDLLLTGTNTADGQVVFDGVLTYTAVGTWYYTIVETGENGQGLTLDPTVYTLAVTVTDQGGSLRADYSILSTAGDTVTFRNRYTAQPAEWILEGSKALTGRNLMNDEFTFLLTQTDAQGNVLPEGIHLETKNFTDGRFAFPAAVFHEAGTYHFAVAELALSSAYGIHYDTTRYQVTVTVTDGGKGQLSVTDVSITAEGKAAEAVTFANAYIPAPTSALIPGTKTLVGKLLGGGDFRFQLYSSDETWAPGQLLETVENGADGSILFRAISFETAGSYYYLVKEVSGGQVIDGVTYDDTVYRVRIDVTDDLRGKLHAEVHFFDGEDIPQDALVFVNRYAITGDVSVLIEGTKTLVGRELAAEEFAFDLLDEAGSPVQTATNGADGAIRFGAMTFTEPGIYRFTVAEQVGTDENVTYDTARFGVTVTVTDNGKGGLDAAVTLEDGAIHFTNVFTPDPDPLTLEILAKKTVKNLGELKIGPENFRFLLENMTLGTDQTALSGQDGLARFALMFTEADIGKTYTYKLSEVNDGREGVEYSTAVYNIAITIALDEHNTLVATVLNNGAEVEQAEGLFENIFHDTPPKMGDGLVPRLLALVLSAGAIVTMLAWPRKKHDD